MKKRMNSLIVLAALLTMLLSSCSKTESLVCNNCSASNPKGNQYCVYCGISFLQSETPTTKVPASKGSTNDAKKLLGVWKTDIHSPGAADILIFNSDNTFFCVCLGEEIPYFRARIISSGTYSVNKTTCSMTITDGSGGHSEVVDYSLTQGTLSFEGLSFHRESVNSGGTKSFVGDWSAYGVEGKLLTIKRDGTFQFHNATFGNNYSSGTYTKSNNVANAIDLYDPNGNYVYTLQQLCDSLMIDEKGTCFLYQKN